MKRKLWIILALAALIAVLGCGTALADQSGQLTGTISWTLTDDGTLTISGSGAIPDYNPRTNPSPFKSRMNIRSVVIGSGINRIGNDTFVACSSTLKSISLPASLGSIGTEAFLGCSGLTEVTLPDGLTRIGRYAFGRTGLTSVVIPVSVANIDEYSFYGCASLTKADVINSSAAFGAQAFGNLPTGFVLHGWKGSTAQTYASDNSLSFSATLSGSCGENVTWSYTDGALTFSGTGSMTNYDSFKSPFCKNSCMITASIGNGVKTIGRYLFQDCDGLTSVIIPRTVTSIGLGAFAGCDGLTDVTIPDSVDRIGWDAFGSCRNLISVTIPNSVTLLDPYVFSDCSKLRDVTIPGSVTIIPERAFEGCFDLTSVTIQNGVTSIHERAFSLCGLPDITIPDSVSTIDLYAFFDSVSLTSATVLNASANIGAGAFEGCNASFRLRGWDPSTTKTYAETYSIPFDSLGSPTGSCGENVTYVFDPTTGTLTISGTGPMADFTSGVNAPWFNFRDLIKSVQIESGVTNIGDGAFYGCTNLTSVTIADSVTRIEMYAFSGCSGLTDITIPDSVEHIYTRAFEGCSGLTGIAIPGHVAEIGGGAFAGCTGLTDIVIPASVTSIGEYAFYNCNGLSSVTILNPSCTIGSGFYGVFTNASPSLVIYGWTGSTAEAYANAASILFVSLDSLSGSCGDNVTYVFDPSTGTLTISGTGPMADFTSGISAPWFNFRDLIKSVQIESGVTNIGDGAFYGCTSLTSVTIPDSVTRIEMYAFSGCSGLTDITIPDSVEHICTRAFEGCSGLTGITIPSHVAEIGVGAFADCSGLTEIIIPVSVTSLGEYAFYNCNELSSVTILNPSCTIGSGFYGVFTNASPSLVIYGLAGSTAQTYANTAGIPFVAISSLPGSNVTWFFDSATGTLYIDGMGPMPDFISETYVPWYSYCGSITSVQIGSSVTSIGNHAFHSCISLNHVYIPVNIARIGSSAFQDCTSLTVVAILNPDCVIGNGAYDVFQGCPSGFTIWSWASSTAEVYAASAQPPCSFDLIVPAPDLILPASLTSIEEDTFYGVPAQAVLIPKSVQAISGNPFENSNVVYIYGFPGTAAKALADSDPVRFMFIALTDAWYARLTN